MERKVQREGIKARNDRIRGKSSTEKLKGKPKGVGWAGGGRVAMSEGVARAKEM